MKINVEFSVEDYGDIDIKPTKKQIEVFIKYILNSIPIRVIFDSGIKLREAKNIKVKFL